MKALEQQFIPARNLDASPQKLHIASLIVHAQPTKMQQVAAWLEEQPGTEIYTHSNQGKFAVVVECDHERDILALMDKLQELPAVLNAALVYHEILDREDDL